MLSFGLLETVAPTVVPDGLLGVPVSDIPAVITSCTVDAMTGPALSVLPGYVKSVFLNVI